ncbi:MAG: NRPS [Chrysothrix sp. TS-e1954]|nr:MAG: NRPS [Chrysothrix sp. TS-e1954]
MDGNLDSHGLDASIVDLFDRWAAKAPSRIAAEWQGETLTYGELRNASLQVSQALLLTGVQPCAKVPLLTQMSLEMLPAVIGILRIGACYAPLDVAVWSIARVEAALLELSAPVALATAACPGLQLPVVTLNFQKHWLKSPHLDTHALSYRLDVLRSRLRDDDLAWIIFTSGTTGKPKGVMVYHRAIHAITVLNHSDDLEAAAERGIRCLLAFSVAFDGCAGVVWTTLTKGGTLAMASPTNFPLVATSCDLLHLTPSMLAILDPAGPYDSVRYIFLGAEAPQLDVVRRWIKPSRKAFNTYGPSETTCIISIGEIKADEEPPFGDLIPGVRIVLVDENLQESDCGEVLIAGPGLAAGYLNDPKMTAKKFIQWKSERFYRTGDLARKTKDGQYIWAGRADSLVKNRGFLINLETEVEPAILTFPSVRIAVALKWRDRLVAFIQPANVEIQEVRDYMKERFDPFIVPDEILLAETFPLNVNGKVDRHALLAQLDARVPADDGAVVSDGHRSHAFEALRKAFSVCLTIEIPQLNENSSFTRLGGNSLAAIKLGNLLKAQGYQTSAIQILKLDTIRRLEPTLKALNNSEHFEQVENGPEDLSHSSIETQATDVQKAMLTRSLNNTRMYALISTTKFVGDSRTMPSVGQLQDAFTRAIAKHSIFQTRFNLTTFALSDIGQRKLHWRNISVEEDEFDHACIAAEETSWLELNDVTQAEIEIPYFHITCIHVEERKALALVIRVHHVLTDVYASALFMRDVERLLAGDEVREGPRFHEFASFMHQYKQENLERAIKFFMNMTESLPDNAMIKPPSPRIPSGKEAFGLTRFVSPTTVIKPALDSCARTRGITPSTIVYAAWALFLTKITSHYQVGFSVSLSGRTIPWPAAQDIVGSLTTRSPVAAVISAEVSVNQWLADMHKTTLDCLEFDGLMHSLPDSVMQDPRTKSSSVVYLLDIPQVSSDWSTKERQEHHYLLTWYVSQDGEGLKTEFEIPINQVDVEWAKEVAFIPGKMLDGLVNATKKTLVRELLE